MKKTGLIVLMALFTVTAVTAQGVAFSIKGGVNASNFVGKEAENVGFKAKIGFQAGLGIDFNFVSGLAVQSGLYVTTKGSKHADVYDFSGMYVQVPLHLAYKVDIMSDTRVFFHGGPYFAYGVAGKSKVDGTTYDTFKQIEVAGKTIAPSKFDAGLGFGAGFEFGPMIMDIGWDLGMVKLVKDYFNATHMTGYFMLGYRF